MSSETPRPGSGQAPRPRALPIAERLHSASIHVLRLVRQVDVEAGVGPAQLSALSVLVFGGPKSLGALAAAEQVRPPSMTRVVKELEAAGYVRRRPDKTDRRAIRLEATAKGVRLMHDGRARRAALLASWLDALDPSALSRLGDALPVIEAVIDRGRRTSGQRAKGKGQREGKRTRA